MNLNGVDLNLLLAFDALMAERSVTRAGRRTGRTQPAMSAALARLRALFGDELFVRAPGGLQPTPRAVEVAEPIRRALATIQQTLDATEPFDPATTTATFTVGCSDHPAYVVLPLLIEHLRHHAPKVALHVRGFTSRDEAAKLLDTGAVDMTIGVPFRGAPNRVLSRPLFQEPFVCIVRKQHPIADRALTLPAFLRLAHVLASPENDRFGQVDGKLAQVGMKRTLALALPHLYAVPALVARSDMIATVMAGVVTASGHARELRILRPPLDLDPVPFVLSWHRRNDAQPAQRWLRECVVGLTTAAPARAALARRGARRAR